MNRRSAAFMTLGKQIEEQKAYIKELEITLVDLYERAKSSQYDIFFKFTYPERCKEIEALYLKVKSKKSS
jgi:hypothetical protein